MGYAARANPRSMDGETTHAEASKHRIWRAVAYFKGNRPGFEDWLAGYQQLPADYRATLERVWDEQNPDPVVTLQ